MFAVVTGGESLFDEFTLVLGIAAVIGLLGVLFRQPLIVSFIFVGVIVGPTVLDLVGESDLWDVLAATGISLLLFVVGLRLDLEEIRATGPVALVTGLGQVIFTSTIGFGLGLMLGLSVTAAAYVAVALTFSSTIIIVKLLSDKREIDSLHGRIAVGFLIVQDMAVVVAMIALSAIGAGGGDPLREAGLVVVKGAGFVAVVALLMWLVLPRLFSVFARTNELLVLGAIALAMAFAVGGEELGFSREVGAFLAGVSLASTPFRDAIASRLVSMRDFLLLFFFVTLGASLDLGMLGGQVVPAIILSVFVLVGNPLIVMTIMGLMGYRRRTGFLAGLTVAQISEFSLILGALGLSLGHIDEETVGLIAVVGLVTIGLSSYLIIYSHPIYERLAPYLSVFERKVPHRETSGEPPPRQSADVLIFGLGRYGGAIAQTLQDRGISVLGVDFDPRVVREWERMGFDGHYGDAEDAELPESLPLSSTRCVISTLPLVPTNVTLLQSLREHGYEGQVALTAHTDRDAERLERSGADLVLRPFSDAAAEAADCIERAVRPAHQAVG